MNMTKTQKIISIIIILALLFLLYLIFDRHSKVVETILPQVNSATSTTVVVATTTSGDMNVQGTGSYTITQVPVTTGQTEAVMPSLTAQVNFGDNPPVSPAVQTTVTENISALQSALQKNPKDFSSWINLGIYQKMGEDYQAAVASWVYASQIAPADYISLGDLGDLYAYFIKDTAKLSAITIRPSQTVRLKAICMLSWLKFIAMFPATRPKLYKQ